MMRSLAAAGLAFALLASPALAQAPAPAAAPTGVAALLQKSETDVRARLGQPHIARREAGGAMWTYRNASCALFVFFKAQGREGLRVSGAAAGPRQRGQAQPNVDACIAATTKS